MKHEINQAPHALLTAALAGLLTVSCGKEKNKEEAAPETTGTQLNETVSKVISTAKAPDLTFAQFSADCDARGGLLQTHASCSGANSCKGVSFNKFSKTLVEHSCKAANTCGGMSCIELPKSSGLSAAEIYTAQCLHCHTTTEGTFSVTVPKGVDLEQAKTDFVHQPLPYLTTIIAFGTQGVNASGTSFSNMPAFYEKLSRAEIESLVTYIQSMPLSTYEYTVIGENE